MERMTSKHSPRVDEQMQHEVESLVRGNAAEESRSREDRTQEGSTEDEARFDPTDADGRSELARHVTAAPWPASRDDLVLAAREDRAPQAVLDSLRTLPASTQFENVQEVWSALGGTTEDTHTGRG